jgi:excinuclease UvrABC nuclease subunit
MKYFGSLGDIRQTTMDEIATETGIPHDVAQVIKGHLD